MVYLSSMTLGSVGLSETFGFTYLTHYQSFSVIIYKVSVQGILSVLVSTTFNQLPSKYNFPSFSGNYLPLDSMFVSDDDEPTVWVQKQAHDLNIFKENQWVSSSVRILVGITGKATGKAKFASR